MQVDYCTNWPDRIGQFDWSHCCKFHDWQYAIQVDKLTADMNLLYCVAEASTPSMALVMYIGVLLFGGKYYINAKNRKK